MAYSFIMNGFTEELSRRNYAWYPRGSGERIILLQKLCVPIEDVDTQINELLLSKRRKRLRTKRIHIIRQKCIFSLECLGGRLDFCDSFIECSRVGSQRISSAVASEYIHEGDFAVFGHIRGDTRMHAKPRRVVAPVMGNSRLARVSIVNGIASWWLSALSI